VKVFPALNRRRVLAGLFVSTAVALTPLLGLTAPAGAANAMAVAAVKEALRGNFNDAGAFAARSEDSAAIKLVELLYLRDHGKDVGFQRIRDFQAAAPKWPLAETLKKRAEQNLLQSALAPEVVVTYFEKNAAITAEGNAAHARALYQLGQNDAAKLALRRAWMVSDMDANVEKQIASEFGGQLTAADHKMRLARLIYAQQSAAAVRHAKRLGADQQKVAQVAQLLLRGAGGAEGAYANLPAALRNELPLRYALARLYRKQEKFGKARNILLNAPGTAAELIDPSAWFDERRIIARRSIGPYNRDTWKAAYQIAARHGIVSGDDLPDAEFLAGWIALRYLKDTDRATKHFTRLEEISSTRTDLARAGYWLGRTAAAANDKSTATKYFKAAAKHSTIYYGQLAREQIGLGMVPEEINSGDASAAAKARIEQDEVIRALRLMYAASGKANLHMFMYSIASRFKSTDDMNAAASIVHGMGGTYHALKLAKVAGQFKVDIDSWAYPLRGLPDWKQVGKPVEKALVFGLSRQESEFNPDAGSRVGAQGLMQLMPGTARLVARQYRLPYAVSKLKSDPAYNVKLGAAHLADLVDDFNGSYVLTLVAYNAGPRRAKEWTAQFGDLRSGQVDPVDWVENIPFQETRQYVQKVLQNVHIYRSRLAPKTVRPMTADLKRGTPSDVNVASISAPEPAANECGSALTSFLSGCE
jgi:soluble lytic murein transglycosylase